MKSQQIWLDVNSDQKLDLTRDRTWVTCLTVRHLNHYTRMFSVLVWGWNWILFMLGWFRPILLIHLIGRKLLHFEKNSMSRRPTFSSAVASNSSVNWTLLGCYTNRSVQKCNFLGGNVCKQFLSHQLWPQILLMKKVLSTNNPVFLFYFTFLRLYVKLPLILFFKI